jgi:hypothetical protein
VGEQEVSPPWAETRNYPDRVGSWQNQAMTDFKTVGYEKVL